MLFWFYQKTYQRWKKTLFKWILQNISENQRFQRTPKFIMSDFYEMDFMKWIVILINVDEIYKILESLLPNRFWSRDKVGVEWSKFLLSLPFIVHTFSPYLLYSGIDFKRSIFISDAWPAFSHKSFGRCFEKTLSSWTPLCSLLSLYLTRNKQILKCSIHCL